MLSVVAAGYRVAVVSAAVRVVGSAHVRYVPLRDPYATSRLAIAVRAERTDPLAVVFRDLTCDLAPSIDAAPRGGAERPSVGVPWVGALFEFRDDLRHGSREAGVGRDNAGGKGARGRDVEAVAGGDVVAE